MTRLSDIALQLAKTEMEAMDAMGVVVDDLRAKGATRQEARILICIYTEEAGHTERALMLFDLVWGEGT